MAKKVKICDCCQAAYVVDHLYDACDNCAWCLSLHDLGPCCHEACKPRHPLVVKLTISREEYAQRKAFEQTTRIMRWQMEKLQREIEERERAFVYLTYGQSEVRYPHFVMYDRNIV